MLESEKKDVFKNNSFGKVDIILPTYKPDVILLKRAIDSILEQEYSDWILYLVQDGNDIDLSSIIKSYNDQRINYLEIPHTGKASALNFALQKGNSKYIAYLDDDDIWYPNHLKVSISNMKANNAKFVHTDAYEVKITKAKDGKLKEISRKNLHLGLITDITLISISHINAVHERALFELTGYYDNSRQFYIDWDMFLRFSIHSKPVHISIYTCEHYIYLDINGKNINMISSIHINNDQLHKMKMDEMLLRSMNEGNYIQILKDWQKKSYEIEYLKNNLKQIINSNSFRITKPLRFFLSLIKKLF